MKKTVNRGRGVGGGRQENDSCLSAGRLEKLMGSGEGARGSSNWFAAYAQWSYANGLQN